MKWTVHIAYISFSPNAIFNSRFFVFNSSLLRKNKKQKRTVQFRPCLQNVRTYTFGFCWKAVLPRNKLLLSKKINCPCEVTLKTIQQLVNCASFKVLAKFKLKPWEIFSVENSKIKHAHWQMKKQINAQVKLHFENDTLSK